MAARPLMGKTWTLCEVARRLEEDHYLVGYHEATGGESSHLLHAVGNLYTHWLSDATLRAQAVSLWERHVGELVPRIGRLVGSMIKEVGTMAVPAPMANIVRSAFDALADSQKSLLNGDLPVAALPYDQALSLVSLVAKVSKRRIVLILDAWEKSPALRFEIKTLESIVKHPDAWDGTHLFLGLRDQDLDPTTINEEACRRGRDLCRLSPACEFYELPLMDQTDSHDRDRMVGLVRATVPAAAEQSDACILEMIGGYPGVLNFWNHEAANCPDGSWDHFVTEALNAHALRYIELDHLLAALPDGARAFAARLAFFPRLDSQRWLLFSDIVLRGEPQTVIDSLVDTGVLIDHTCPTYGHDTRHFAARRWFVAHALPLMRRSSEMSVTALAARITASDDAHRPLYETLVACSDTARAVGSSAQVLCLLDAVQSITGLRDPLLCDEFETLWPQVLQRDSRFLPLMARALVNRGYTRLQRDDLAGAHIDFTTVIDLHDAPKAEVAEAFYNRAHIKGVLGEHAQAIRDYDSAIARCDARPEVLPKALCNRAIQKAHCADHEGAICDYTAIIEPLGSSATELAKALINRAVQYQTTANSAAALEDCTKVIEMDDVPVRQRVTAYYNRALFKSMARNSHDALADYTAGIELPDAPVDLIMDSLCNRGVIEVGLGNYEGAVTGYNIVVASPEASADQRALAFYNRGVARHWAGAIDAAVADFDTVIEMSDVLPVRRVEALTQRAECMAELGEHEKAIAGYTAVIALSDSTTEDLARLLYNRAVSQTKRGDFGAAVADYDAIIELRGTPVDLLARALGNRGVRKCVIGNLDGATADFTALIGLPAVPQELAAWGQLNREAVESKQRDGHATFVEVEKCSADRV